MQKQRRISKAQLREFINKISRLLEIQSPKISTDTNFAAETFIAQYDPETDTVFVDMFQEPRILLFTAAHELRHKWQRENDPDFYFGDYKPRSDFNDSDAYNLQTAELDANAFGFLVMEIFLGVEIHMNGLKESTEIKILDTMDELSIYLDYKLMKEPPLSWFI